LKKDNNSLQEQIKQLQNDAKKALNAKLERRKAAAIPSSKKNKEDEEMAETIVLLENQLRKLEKENENLQTESKQNNGQHVGSKTDEQIPDFKIANEKLKQEVQALQKQNQKQKEEHTILESKQKNI